MVDAALIKRGLGDLQRSLERFETYNDGFILPDTYLVVRLDAHRYGDWSGVPDGEYPCGPILTSAFHETAVSLMASAFRIVLSYCHGDEISLFIAPVEGNNATRRSRVISLLSSAASIHFREASGLAATFQARLSELPSLNRVIEYFFWQRRYCYRNAVTISLRRSLENKGFSAQEIESMLHGKSEEQRLALSREHGDLMSQLSPTTRQGALFWWKDAGTADAEKYQLASALQLPEDDRAFLEILTPLMRGKAASVNNAPSGRNEVKKDSKATKSHSKISKAPQHKNQSKTTPKKFRHGNVVVLSGR